ncbi:MAG: ABC transporter substrate-binding protein [Chloroflexi bacterium]|nr:ABC transporter substrate-binding protein [Chloroflexota bacterium]
MRHPSALRAWLLPVILFIAACGASGGTLQNVPTGTPSPATNPSATPAVTATPGPVTLTDDEGTTVVIPDAPQAIVSLTPAATEILFAIGAGDRVVAKVEDITPYPPAADDLPVVATFEGTDVEHIVGLEADLVIAGGLGFTPPDAVTQLRGLDIPVVVVYADDVETALADIELIGQAAWAADAAQALSGEMRADLDALAALTADLPKPRVFYEIDATSAIYTAPADSVYAEMLALAGSDPITTDASYVISIEQLVAADPEIILLGDGAYGVTAEQVAARPAWDEMTAVVNGDIFPVDDVVITRPGPRLVDGLRALIAAIHPDVVLPPR